MEKNILVSIVIPCYNDAQYIEQAVNSALDQTYPYKEVIVVDDGSDIETKAVLQKLAGKVTKLITQENKGQSSARNAGIRESKGEYILVLDSDDYFEPSFVEKAIAIVLNVKDIKLVTCYANLIFEHIPSYLYIPLGGTIQAFLCSNNALGSSLFKKDDWFICDGYDETMTQGFEDWEFFIRILKYGGSAHVIQEPLYYYRKRNLSTTSRANKVKYELFNYIYNKHSDVNIENYKIFVSYLLSKIEREETEKIKNTQRLEFIIGSYILMPFRIIKKIFNIKHL